MNIYYTWMLWVLLLESGERMFQTISAHIPKVDFKCIAYSNIVVCPFQVEPVGPFIRERERDPGEIVLACE